MENVEKSEKSEKAENQEESLFREFWLFLREEKKWWLGPIVVLLVTLSAVIIFAEGSSIAPFIYSLF
ncbi:hypothetical protein HY251_00065 [bacterium]|nr:hypothetical protein [bacterium]